MKKLALIILLVSSIAVDSWAIQYTGSISNIAPDTTLVTGGQWLRSILSWSVDDATHLGLWTYEYEFAAGNSPGLSHSIIEVSQNFTEDNIFNGTTDYDEIRTFGIEPSNPGIPGDVYGIKWNFENSITWTIVTDRAPMWGDFYAKGGGNSVVGYAYNSQFGNDTIASIGNGNAGGWVLVPDTTTTVPEPSTLLLLGAGLIGLAGYGRKNLFKK